MMKIINLIILSFSQFILYYYAKNINVRKKCIWDKKTVIDSISNSTIYLKSFPYYNFSMYIRNENDHISNILRKGYIYNDCIILYNIWINTNPEKDSIFIDAGANIGTCSLFLMNYGIKTISFEPVDDNLKLFTNSIMHNKCMVNLITLYTIGLGSLKCIKTMHCYKKNMGSSSIINEENSNYLVNVHIDRLDSLIQANEKIHLLKIDVEGYEFEVIKGSEKLLKQKVINYIFIEINCSILRVKPKAIYDYLEKFDYISNNKYYCGKKQKGKNVLFYRRELLNSIHF